MELDLFDYQLTGSIPPEIGELTNLTYLRLSYNDLTGEIPSWIGNLTSLTLLDLGSNLLSGEIPSEIGNLTNLERLELLNNQLSGEIPSEIGSLTNLTELWLGWNQLSGEIPSEIGSLTNLTALGLYNNQLTGEIPQAVCDLLESNNLDMGYILNGNDLTNTCDGNSCDVTTINDVEWTLDEYTFSNTSLTATGVITNVGDPTILAPWSVEAEFYSDSTFTLILGGNQQLFNMNLQSGVSSYWTLSYSSTDIVESNYPNFAIKNFRAFINTCE